MFKMKCEGMYEGWFFRVYHRNQKCILRVIKTNGNPSDNMRFQLNDDRIGQLKTIQQNTANQGEERTKQVLELAREWDARH